MEYSHIVYPAGISKAVDEQHKPQDGETIVREEVQRTGGEIQSQEPKP
jgi:hypothetical protein